MNKVYLIPVKRACNANCTFCISKDYANSKVSEIMDINNPETLLNLKESLNFIKEKFKIDTIEVTGGGEPFLNKNLQDIIDIVRSQLDDIWVKLYTNGFIHKNIKSVNELNISRSHWDSEKNNIIYKSKFQNDLGDTIKFFRPIVEELRLCTIKINGIMDNSNDYLKMVKMYEDLVDKFVLRPLIPEKKNIEKLFVDFSFEHPKVKHDEIECHCHKNLVIGTDGLIYEDFNFNEKFIIS